MTKIQRIFVSGIITLIIGYFGYSILYVLKYHHHVDMNNYKRYLWLFNDNAKSEVDTFFYAEFERAEDILCKYTYKNFNVFIWDFKDLTGVELNDIHINQNTGLKGLKFNSKEILNMKNIPEINIRYQFTFDNSFNVNLSGNSKIVKNIESKNYKGFYGLLTNRMSISNKYGEHQIYFEYGLVQQPTLFLVYKGHKRFFVIIINSDADDPFDAYIFNSILNMN